MNQELSFLSTNPLAKLDQGEPFSFGFASFPNAVAVITGLPYFILVCVEFKTQPNGPKETNTFRFRTQPDVNGNYQFIPLGTGMNIEQFQTNPNAIQVFK